LVVPLVAKKVVRIKSAYPFILGANIGTTITAFIAAMFNSNAAISIAIAHFLFNLIGVLIFFPIPYLNQLPIKLADRLGRFTLKYRLVGFLYVLLTFFFIPFSLIYFNKNTVTVQELTYRHTDFVTGENQSYTILNKTYLNQPITNWIQYESIQELETDPLKIRTVYRRKNLLLINNELFELNKPGFCRDGEDEHGKFKTCIREILPSVTLPSSQLLDSVYVFERTWYQPDRVDSSMMAIYISASQNVVTKREVIGKRGAKLLQEELFQLKEK
jgi:sodium-dependent phosphate cotransporter